MKTNNKKKIVVSVLALAMGAGLAGSVSGSVAWYQYSTRTSANFVGTTAGTTRELQIALKPTQGNPAWNQNITIPEATFKPTSIFTDNNGIHFVDHPVYKSPVLPEVLTPAQDGYILEFSFIFKCVDGDGQKAKNVYLTYFDIVDKPGANEDPNKNITPAVRVYLEGASMDVSEPGQEEHIIQNKFILGQAENGGTTNTYGQLDLNGNNKNDRDGYDTNDVYDKDGRTDDTEPAAGYITYTNLASQTPSYTFSGPSSAYVHDTSNPYEFADDHLQEKLLTQTSTTGASAEVKVKVWIEGWQTLPTGNVEKPYSSVWDSTWLNQNFELRFQFACEADR